MIQMRNVDKSFGTKKILDSLTLNIPTGSVFGLVGPNGSGKSTILRLLSGVYQLDGGFITIDEMPVYDNVKMKERIFFVSDDPFYFQNANLIDMKEFYQLFYPKFSEEKYQLLLKAFPISEKMHIDQMSKGMKRQAILIMALASNPDYLFLDEAFDGLDPVMRLNLKKLISEDIENHSMSVIISSHNLRELEDICDQLGMLHNQKITVSGDVETIKTSLVKIQIGTHEELSDEIFQKLLILNKTKVGSVYTLVLRNSKEDCDEIFLPLQPILYEELPLTLEEVFIYEMEADGYGNYED